MTATVAPKYTLRERIAAHLSLVAGLPLLAGLLFMEGDGGGDEPPPDPKDPPPAGDPPLGPAGEKALEEFKQRARAAEKLAKDREAELEKLRAERMSDQEKALADARKEAEDSTRTALEPQLRTARVENAILRAAGGRFADVDDAILHLRDDPTLVGDDGQVDAKAITKAIDGLLERKPHLAAGGGTPPPKPRPHQGGGPAPTEDAERSKRIAAAVKAQYGIQ